MAKIEIDIYRKKTLEDFSEIISKNDSKLETGSASAYVASLAAALLSRASKLADDKSDYSERLQYIQRNSEIIRNYMSYLVDEDVKCRNPIKKALAEGNPQHIEACVQPACAINSEIINMMLSLLELCSELVTSMGVTAHYVYESAELAFSAIKTSMSFIYDMLHYCTDDTYIYVTKRENEISLSQAKNLHEGIESCFTMPI